MSRVFISYRREDSAGWTGRLADRLREHLWSESVFIEMIEPGTEPSISTIGGWCLWSPISELSESVEGHSAKEGLVEFVVPKSVRQVLLQIRQEDDVAELPFVLSQ